MIHVMAVGGLSGAAVSTAIMGDNSIAMMQEEQHLVIPVVGTERPTMAENYRLSIAPVLVVNLDTVFRRNRGHENFLLSELIQTNRIAERPGPNPDVANL